MSYIFIVILPRSAYHLSYTNIHFIMITPRDHLLLCTNNCYYSLLFILYSYRLIKLSDTFN